MSSIGDMRERVAFTRKAKVRREDGGYDTTPTTIATVWAKVRPVQARESEQAGRLRGATTYVLDIYRRTDLATEDNCTWLTGGNLALNVREIRLPPARPLMMEIVADSESVG